MRKVCKWILRAMFNDGHFVERAEAGELLVTGLDKPRTPDPARRMPPGTLSYFLTYVDSTGIVVARAHWDVVPRERSRRPDPKYLRTESGENLTNIIDPSHHCEHCRPERGDPDYPG